MVTCINKKYLYNLIFPYNNQHHKDNTAEQKPQIFKIKPLEFKNKLLNLTTNLKNDHQQPGEIGQIN